MNTPDRTLDCPKWKSHEYKVCYTHQVLHFIELIATQRFRNPRWSRMEKS